MKNIGRRPKHKHPNPDFWLAIRKNALERDQGCRLCFSNDEQRLEVHHRTYERFGCEDLNDLTTLCNECHSLITLAQMTLRDVNSPIKSQAVATIEIGRIEISNFYTGERND